MEDFSRYLNRDFSPPFFNSKKHKIFIQALKTYIFAAFSLLLLFHFTQSSIFQNQLRQSFLPSVVSETSLRVTKVLPVRLKIPAINVNANIQQVGFTKSREMGVPNNTVDVGWFNLGPIPGEQGSAVIDGHFDGGDGSAGVFTDLYKLKSGDKLYVEDNRGKTTTFIVQENKTFDPGLAEGVFSRSDGVHLNLITCDGTWDGTKKSYNKRLVVFADALK